MNKLLTVLLFVCLVSVHAFVKREAETPQADPLAKIQQQFADVTKNINEKLSEFFNTEEMKKGFSHVVDKINEAVSQLNSKKEEGKQ
ncbi:unnamed protein product [Euphydryas editha]|uniref:Uncharacterized protein n=1 Tax=Euphydryas editha TaxID=104508 RepID=A0AAU9TJ13_EUPED|nr:unnamed protein product [Euphydryas editha]